MFSILIIPPTQSVCPWDPETASPNDLSHQLHKVSSLNDSSGQHRQLRHRRHSVINQVSELCDSLCPHQSDGEEAVGFSVERGVDDKSVPRRPAFSINSHSDQQSSLGPGRPSCGPSHPCKPHTTQMGVPHAQSCSQHPPQLQLKQYLLDDASQTRSHSFPRVPHQHSLSHSQPHHMVQEQDHNHTHVPQHRSDGPMASSYPGSDFHLHIESTEGGISSERQDFSLTSFSGATNLPSVSTSVSSPPLTTGGISVKSASGYLSNTNSAQSLGFYEAKPNSSIGLRGFHIVPEDFCETVSPVYSPLHYACTLPASDSDLSQPAYSHPTRQQQSTAPTLPMQVPPPSSSAVRPSQSKSLHPRQHHHHPQQQQSGGSHSSNSSTTSSGGSNGSGVLGHLLGTTTSQLSSSAGRLQSNNNGHSAGYIMSSCNSTSSGLGEGSNGVGEITVSGHGSCRDGTTGCSNVSGTGGAGRQFLCGFPEDTSRKREQRLLKNRFVKLPLCCTPFYYSFRYIILFPL
ncbi:unnamed protein product [Protopolystoma xenopodis]|uniref:Uncharacterized protein n=1 Tax=Protopolystoma xenopodis TaxID=117903 RepID=A0A3S5FH25_9PLAT|nr:unnamed protein product [Protopolystoma xenopodis]